MENIILRIQCLSHAILFRCYSFFFLDIDLILNSKICTLHNKLFDFYLNLNGAPNHSSFKSFIDMTLSLLWLTQRVWCVETRRVCLSGKALYILFLYEIGRCNRHYGSTEDHLRFVKPLLYPLTHWGRNKMAAIFHTTVSNGFSWMKMYEFRLTFHWSLFLGVQINNIPTLVHVMAWRRPGDMPLSEPMMVRLPTHICVTRPQWVK